MNKPLGIMTLIAYVCYALGPGVVCAGHIHYTAWALDGMSRYADEASGARHQ
jgi:hypothetical protein